MADRKRYMNERSVLPARMQKDVKRQKVTVLSGSIRN